MAIKLLSRNFDVFLFSTPPPKKNIFKKIFAKKIQKLFRGARKQTYVIALPISIHIPNFRSIPLFWQTYSEKNVQN